MLELYRWEPNMFSLKPLIVLHEKGLAFEDRYVDFLSLAQFELPSTATSVETKHNPEGDGPVLVDRGAPMTLRVKVRVHERHDVGSRSTRRRARE